MKSWFKIENADGKKSASADVFIFDEIGAFGITAAAFSREFNAIQAKVVNVHINSPGGSVFDGMAIFNTLDKAKDKIVNTFIEGVAASMGSVISLAGDFVTMTDNSLFMIHNPVALAVGEKKDMEKTANLLEKVKDQIITVYQAKTKMKREEIAALMDDETWMDAKEAFANGFVDAISEGMKVAACFDIGKFNFKNAAKYETFKENFKPETGGKSMTLEELKAKHPELYAQAMKDGEDKAKAAAPAPAPEGSVSKEDHEAATKKAADEAAANAAANERQRIQDIESLAVNAEAKKIVDAEKVKPEATKESVAALIVQAAKDKKLGLEANFQVDTDDLNDAMEKIKSAPPVEDGAEENDLLAHCVAGMNDEPVSKN